MTLCFFAADEAADFSALRFNGLAITEDACRWRFLMREVVIEVVCCNCDGREMRDNLPI